MNSTSVGSRDYEETLLWAVCKLPVRGGANQDHVLPFCADAEVIEASFEWVVVRPTTHYAQIFQDPLTKESSLIKPYRDSDNLTMISGTVLN